MSSNNNLNDSTSVTTSNESYLPFPTDVVYVEITRRAKRHYRDVGQNSWKHIQQVYSQAARACSFVDNRDLNLKEYAAILYHDSSVKTDVTKDGHNVRGARIAKSELVDLFSKSDLLEIVQAIEEHDGYTSWSSTTSDLLATGDANPPDIPWILNKSYTWGIKKGLDHDGRIRNILATLPKKYGTNGTTIYPSHYLKYFGNSLKAAQKYIDHLTYEKVEKAVLAYRKQHKLSDTDLTLPEPSVEELDVSELEPLEINPEHKTDRFKDDKLAINEIDEKSLNMTIVEELERHVEYLEILKHWITTPDYTLVDKLAVFGAFIDKLYNFNKGFIAYRGMRVGKTDKPLQNTMGIIDATESELVPKPGVIPGYKFTYTTTGPMSVSRSVWLSKVYGDCIVKTTVPKECKKLVITNELAYVLQKLDKKYPDYRPINLSARLEIIVLPNQTLNYSVVTTNGDITSEMPEFKDLDYSNKKIELDPTYSIGEEQLSNLLLERRTLFESEIKEVSANEALSDAAISKKKREIIDKICKICDIIDPSKLNSKRYHRLLDDMTPKEFNQWMTYVKDGKWVLHIVAPNMVVNLKNENLLKAADAVGVKLFHRIWMTDSSTGRKFLTDNEYLVLPLPIRRQQQFLDEKMSVPDDDKHIDGMTGQVTGDSKATQITTPEINILAFKGLDNTLDEMVSVRGGNMVAYGEFKKQAEDTGIVHLNTLDPTTHSRTAVVAQVLLHAMHIENNIVPETQI